MLTTRARKCLVTLYRGKGSDTIFLKILGSTVLWPVLSSLLSVGTGFGRYWVGVEG